MSFIKIYVSSDERAEIEKNAKVEGVSVSAYVKKMLQLKSASRISQVLLETIELAEALSSCDFIISDLYSGVAWGNLTKEINPGQLGKQFFEQVQQGNVTGVSHIGDRNRKALYRKV